MNAADRSFTVNAYDRQGRLRICAQTLAADLDSAKAQAGAQFSDLARIEIWDGFRRLATLKPSTVTD